MVIFQSSAQETNMVDKTEDKSLSAAGIEVSGQKPEWKTPTVSEISIVEDTHSRGSSANDFLSFPHS